MRLKINEKPPLKQIEFSCDAPLNAKLDKYPLTKDLIPLLLLGRWEAGSRR